MSTSAPVKHKTLSQAASLSRRGFLGASASAGLLVAFHTPLAGSAFAQTAVPLSPEVNAWVVVKPDDTVDIRIASLKMGQGTLTGLAQRAAEELECDWAIVTTEYPTSGQNLARARVWGNFGTGSSRGIRESQDYVRKGGTTARMMLVQAAADEWKVLASECRAASSVITHTPFSRTTTYGKVSNAAEKVTPPTTVALKDPKDWKLVGKRLARRDTVEKVTGKQIYGSDLTMPGMLKLPSRTARCSVASSRALMPPRLKSGPVSRKYCGWATAPWLWWPTPGGEPKVRWTCCP